jgi:hypothetical protein
LSKEKINRRQKTDLGYKDSIFSQLDEWAKKKPTQGRPFLYIFLLIKQQEQLQQQQ